MRRSQAQAHGGFTLVELLASFVLVALVIPVAMRGVSLSTGLGSHAKKQLEAAGLAQTRLTEIVLNQEFLNGSQSGDFGELAANYRWELEVGDFADATLKELVLRVIWESRQQDYAVTLSTLVYTQES